MGQWGQPAGSFFYRETEMKTGQLIGLTGYATCGKDAAADQLVEREDYVKIGFADPLYEMALWADPVLDACTEGGLMWRLARRAAPWLFRKKLSDIVGDIGWTEAKRIPAVRQYLQGMGMAVREELGEDTWVNTAMEKADELRSKGVNCIITNVRFENEAHAIKGSGGIIVKVERPGVGPVNSHCSDQGEAFEHACTTVVNDGTDLELGDRMAEIHQSISPEAGTPIDADAATAHILDRIDNAVEESILLICKTARPWLNSHERLEENIANGRIRFYQELEEEGLLTHVEVDGSPAGTVLETDGFVSVDIRVAG